MICWDRWREQISGRLYAASRVLTQIHSKDNHIIHDIAHYLEQHYHEEISLQQIAGKFFLSREYISRKFKQEFGVTLSDFLGRIRIDKAKTLLLNPRSGSPKSRRWLVTRMRSILAKCSKDGGFTPNEYRKKPMS